MSRSGPTDAELLTRCAYRVAGAFLAWVISTPSSPPDYRREAARLAKASFKLALVSPPEPGVPVFGGGPAVMVVWWAALESMGWAWGEERSANLGAALAQEERMVAGVVSALERWRLGLPEEPQQPR